MTYSIANLLVYLVSLGRIEILQSCAGGEGSPSYHVHYFGFYSCFGLSWIMFQKWEFFFHRSSWSEGHELINSRKGSFKAWLGETLSNLVCEAGCSSSRQWDQITFRSPFLWVLSWVFWLFQSQKTGKHWCEEAGISRQMYLLVLKSRLWNETN